MPAQSMPSAAKPGGCQADTAKSGTSFLISFAREDFQASDVVFQNLERIFDRSSAGHVHAGDLEDFHWTLRGTRLQEIDVILCGVRRATEDSFGDGVGGGDADGILERVVVD